MPVLVEIHFIDVDFRRVDLDSLRFKFLPLRALQWQGVTLFQNLAHEKKFPNETPVPFPNRDYLGLFVVSVSS